MKKHYFKWVYFAWANVIVFLTSILSALFSVGKHEFFYFGFPAPFLTIHASQGLNFSVYLGIGALILDLLLGYLICAFIVYLINKTKKPTDTEKN